MDDLAAAILAQQGGGPALPVGYRAGLIIEFDQATFENVVRVDGQDLENLKVLSVSDAATYAEGAVVGVLAVGGTGAVTYAIIGRFLDPGSDAVTDALAALGSRFHSDFIDTAQTRSNTSYGNLTTVGPEVDVTIGPGGRALVIITTELAVGTTGNGALMSYAVSGATTRSASDNWAVAFSPATTGAVMFSRASLQTGLTPGVNTFTAKYRSVTTSSSVTFQHREIIVWAI